jgi:1,4-dihydroxy-2-naphthoate octaprenyltransferase
VHPTLRNTQNSLNQIDLGAFPSLGIWIRAARLRTLPLSVSGIVIGAALALDTLVFDWLIFILALLTTVSYQVLSNFANDYGDGVKGTDNKDRLGPKRGLQSGEIDPKKMRTAIWITSFIALCLTVLLVYISFRTDLEKISFFLGLGGLAIAAAIFYTIGSKAYGYKGLGDVFVFVFFGLVSVMGSYYLFSKSVDVLVLLPASAVGFLSVAVLNLNNMRDVSNDQNFGKNTLAVRLGTQKANAYHAFLIVTPLLATLLYAYLSGNMYANFIVLILLFPLLTHLKRVWRRSSEKDLDAELKKIALTTFFYACLLSVAINL